MPKAAASNSTDEGDQSLKDEARLEALERGVKRKQGATSPALDLMHGNAGIIKLTWMDVCAWCAAPANMGSNLACRC